LVERDSLRRTGSSSVICSPSYIAAHSGCHDRAITRREKSCSRSFTAVIRNEWNPICAISSRNNLKTPSQVLVASSAAIKSSAWIAQY
jgi:hypothetical protein